MTSMTVNGEAIRYKLDPETPLLFALRDASNLTGTKHGCYSGDCGTCTVIVDGRAVLSCQMTIAAAEVAAPLRAVAPAPPSKPEAEQSDSSRFSNGSSAGTQFQSNDS